jgi:hypothetical protein
MAFFSRMMDVATRGSDSPVRRLIVYYVFLAVVMTALLSFFPQANLLFSGERLEELETGSQVLRDAMPSDSPLGAIGDYDLPPRLHMALTAFGVMLGALVLMVPVTWVFMAIRRTTGYTQSIVHTMLILPIVVAGIVLVVRNSLALAFSLAGIVAGVRFRANLRDNRDTVFIFLAIGVGLAAGVQALTVAAILSLVFNFVVLTMWRTHYGSSPLDQTMKVEWQEPLSALAPVAGAPGVPDRELMLSLTPENAGALADRFNRLRTLMGDPAKNGGKPQFNAVLRVSTHATEEARLVVEPILRSMTKRFRLDDVEHFDGKPDQLYYLVRVRKDPSHDDVLASIMGTKGDVILGAEFELGRELSKT